ncbi:iron chelate uptake ABC transporter family permease subunit [Metabacillus niabensis]
MLIARVLNLLRLGDEAAQGRGLPVQTVRLLILFIGVLLVSSVIANCGPIGYISLLAPHLARKMLRTENAFKVLPTAAMIGSVLLLGADLAARLLFYPLEIPVGLLTTIIGGSILLIFLVKRRSNK